VSLHELPSSQLVLPIDMSPLGVPHMPGCIDSRRLQLVWKLGSGATDNQPQVMRKKPGRNRMSPPERGTLYTG
jgi:hypothetical protein